MSRSPCRVLARRWAVAAGLILLSPAVSASAAAGRLSAEKLFRQRALRQLVVSPSGTILASFVERGGWDRVLVRRRDTANEVVAFERRDGIRRVAWIDDEHLLVLLGRLRQPTYRVVTISLNGGELVTQDEGIRATGQLVNRLPNMGDQVLWAVETGTESSVYRLRISALLGEKDRVLEEFSPDRRVASLGRGIDRWVADRHGSVRAALRVGRGSQKSQLWYRDSADTEWRLLVETDDPEEIARPLGIAENDRDLVVASRVERDTWALFELSSETGLLGRELFAHPEADVTDVMYDYSGAAVIGATYQREGLGEFHYFDAFYDRYQRSLEHALPGAVVDMVSLSRDRRYLVVVARSPRDPGTYYVLDTATNTAKEVGRVMPWLDPDELVDVEALRVHSADETELEVFVALPKRGGRKPPLVVLPHGGPIGVRDSRYFDPLLQYLANGGIAVLQVNYRGSTGRGRSFLEAGKHEWGKGIEEDLMAAVDEVVRLDWIDADRVCIAGGSYGGYSAVISVIQWPGRYRCAASLNGPMDLAFLFHSNFGRSKEGREYFTEFIGDPEHDYEKLLSISPAYRASEIRVPVLLVQATDDRRVDVDHYYRMLTMLELLGKPHEAYLIKGGGHILTETEWVDFARRLRTFLARHLQPG